MRGVDVAHPLNAAILAAMASPLPWPPDQASRFEWRQEAAREEGPGEGEPPGAVSGLALGTHPDIVDRLWTIGRSLPADASWTWRRRPVLVHPMSGVVFGLGVGTLGYGLRSPSGSPDLGRAVQKTFVTSFGPRIFSWSTYGTGWAFGDWTDADFALARDAWRGFA
jgi:hypothetical protein